MNYYRGHKIEYSGGVFRYKDTRQKVFDNPNRECGFCGCGNTNEGYDGCLGKLPGLMNACCGHGKSNEAYVQFLDGCCVRGENAVSIQKILIKNK